MAINQLNVTTNDIAGLITNVTKVYKTQADITLTNFTGTGVPAVQAGSIFANNGTSFEVDANATINDSGVANGWVYVKYSVSNARFEYNVTAPTWSDTKQGYYVSNDRYFFKMYKVGAADFRYKLKLKTTYAEVKIFENDLYRSYTAETENTIYDDLTYLLPSTGDAMTVDGFGPGLDVLGALYRVNATALALYSGGVSVVGIVDGDTSTHTISFSISGILL